MIVPHQGEEALVDAGRVLELRVGVPGRERRDSGVERRGIAHPGILYPVTNVLGTLPIVPLCVRRVR